MCLVPSETRLFKLFDAFLNMSNMIKVQSVHTFKHNFYTYVSIQLTLYFGHQMKAETENIISLILLLSHDLELSVDKENTLKFWSARDWGGM